MGSDNIPDCKLSIYKKHKWWKFWKKDEWIELGSVSELSFNIKDYIIKEQMGEYNDLH